MIMNVTKTFVFLMLKLSFGRMDNVQKLRLEVVMCLRKKKKKKLLEQDKKFRFSDDIGVCT